MKCSTAIAFVVCVALLAGACNRTGATQTLTRSIELEQVESADVHLDMQAGELSVSGGSPRLMDASFRFNVASWEPAVDYQSGARGSLRVRQPEGSTSFGNNENTWDVRLNDAIPIDLTVRLGAGEAMVSLGTVDLRSLEFDQGAGQLQLDLRGMPRHSYDVQVNGGVGEAHIRVPRSVAIVATATGGLGSVNVQGLEKRGDSWYNPAHENDPVTIHLQVKGGIGEITISAE